MIFLAIRLYINLGRPIEASILPYGFLEVLTMKNSAGF